MYHKIHFFIRIRENMQVYVPGKGMTKTYWLFNYYGLNKSYSHPKIVQIGYCWVYLSGLKFVNDKGKFEFLIVASYTQNDNQTALVKYKLRWQIETMFKALKSSGFNLEDTHLSDYQRLNKLLFIVTIAFIWAYKVGIYRHNNLKSIPIKKPGRVAQSIFAYGLRSVGASLH